MANAAGLEYTFLLFLGALLIAGLFSLTALRTYPRDVATAIASAEAIGQAAVAPAQRTSPWHRTRPWRPPRRKVMSRND